MEKFAKEIDIKNSDSNDLIAIPNALKNVENDYIGIIFIIEFHSEQLLWHDFDFKNSTIQNLIYWFLQNTFRVGFTISVYVVPKIGCNFLKISMDLLKV